MRHKESKPIMTAIKQVTLNDVAKASGVSYQTVSRVVNNHPSVAVKTRKRVQKAIDQLGYQPNEAARRLATGRSNTIGLISFGTAHYGPSQMSVNIERALKTRDFSLIISSIDAMTIDELKKAITYLKGQLVDGIIMITPIADIDLSAVTDLCQNIPFIMIDVHQGAHIPSVSIDQAYGAELATQHLLDLGHKHVAHISGPLDWNDARMRYKSWQDTLNKNNLKSDIHKEADWTAQGGYDATRELIKQHTFSALFAANDKMALGAIYALRENGKRVPEDISIIGFDDMPEAAFFTPSLTTIRQDFAVLGVQTAEYLIALIDNDGTPLHQRMLYPSLIQRNSTQQLE